MEVQFITPKKIEIFKNIQKISAPTPNGQIQILTNHAETFFLLTLGQILLENKKNKKNKKKKTTIETTTGEIYIKNNVIKVIF